MIIALFIVILNLLRIPNISCWWLPSARPGANLQVNFLVLRNTTRREEERTGCPKNALSECCWSHSALAQSQVAGNSFVWKLIFWSFLTKTMPDQAFPSHFHGKISPTTLNFVYDFVLLVHFFCDTLYDKLLKKSVSWVPLLFTPLLHQTPCCPPHQ